MTTLEFYSNSIWIDRIYSNDRKVSESPRRYASFPSKVQSIQEMSAFKRHDITFKIVNKDQPEERLLVRENAPTVDTLGQSYRAVGNEKYPHSAIAPTSVLLFSKFNETDINCQRFQCQNITHSILSNHSMAAISIDQLKTSLHGNGLKFFNNLYIDNLDGGVTTGFDITLTKSNGIYCSSKHSQKGGLRYDLYSVSITSRDTKIVIYSPRVYTKDPYEVASVEGYRFFRYGPEQELKYNNYAKDNIKDSGINSRAGRFIPRLAKVDDEPCRNVKSISKERNCSRYMVYERIHSVTEAH